MHEQVMVLGTLWRLDQLRDALISEARDLADKVNQARQAIEAVQSHIADLDSQAEELTRQEGSHNQRLESFAKRRDKTRLAIDEGQISDYLVAEKQVTDCGAIVDREEEALLEIMEQQDALSEGRANAVSGLGLRRGQLETARTRENRRRPDLEAELAILTDKRDDARKDLLNENLKIYDQRRRKGKRILAPLENKTCGHCQVRLPVQKAADVKRGVEVYRCSNCGCYVSPGTSA